MLKDSGLGSYLWPEAIRTAVYLKNRSPTRVLDKTPYEAWTGDVPDLSRLRVFGTTAWYIFLRNVASKELSLTITASNAII